MLNLKYKLYYNRKNQRLVSLNKTACIIWNHITALQKRYYKIYGGYVSANKMQKHIAKLRKNNNYWLKLNSQSVQEICQRHDTAYQRFFKKLAKRPPKFKKIKNFKSFVLKQSGWTIKDNRLTINKIGTFKFSKSRNYENVKRITIKQNTLGEIFIILTCDMLSENFKRLDDTNIGIDFGLKTYLTLSNGTEYVSPEFFKNHSKNIKKANRILSRKKKGSNNRKRALKTIQRLHIDIANKRTDYQYKLAHELCYNYSFIAIEDLNIKAMQKIWGRKINDLSHGSFIQILQHISTKHNTIIQKIDRFYPSSKLCYCGFKNKDLKLSDRVWTCSECGSINHRDKLASENILSEGIRLYRTKCNPLVSNVV
jgi:putative transposase